MDKVEIIALVERTRRAMPRNADVLALCAELELRVVTPVVTPAAVVTRNQPKRDRAAYMRRYRAGRRAGS